MKATTIKVEYPLLKKVQDIIPREMSLSAFVRGLLEKEVIRQEMIRASEAYCQFMESHPGEKAWLEEWERADLGSPPRHTARRGKKR